MTQVPATQSIVRKEANKKITLFIGLLSCIVLAVTF